MATKKKQKTNMETLQVEVSTKRDMEIMSEEKLEMKPKTCCPQSKKRDADIFHYDQDDADKINDVVKFIKNPETKLSLANIVHILRCNCFDKEDIEEDMLPMYCANNSTDNYKISYSSYEAATVLFHKDEDGTDLRVLEMYNRVIISAPPPYHFYADCAHCLFFLGRFNAAIRDCNAALAIESDTTTLKLRDSICEIKGDYKLKLKDLVARDSVQRQMLKEEVMKNFQDRGGLQQFMKSLRKENLFGHPITPPPLWSFC